MLQGESGESHGTFTGQEHWAQKHNSLSTALLNIRSKRSKTVEDRKLSERDSARGQLHNQRLVMARRYRHRQRRAQSIRRASHVAAQY